jgi:hypothetical protein
MQELSFLRLGLHDQHHADTTGFFLGTTKRMDEVSRIRCSHVWVDTDVVVLVTGDV